MRISKLMWVLMVIVFVLIVAVGFLSFNVAEQSITIKNYENSFGEMPPP